MGWPEGVATRARPPMPGLRFASSRPTQLSPGRVRIDADVGRVERSDTRLLSATDSFMPGSGHLQGGPRQLAMTGSNVFSASVAKASAIRDGITVSTGEESGLPSPELRDPESAQRTSGAINDGGFV